MSSPLLASQESLDFLANHALNATVAPNAHDAARNNIVREMVETERKYVQDLEVMQVRRRLLVLLLLTDVNQKYATALSQSNTIDQDTIHLLFPGLNKLLNFQRKFLIRLESTAELPWKDQRWGLHFLENVSPIVPFLVLNMCLMRRFHCLVIFRVLFGTIGRRVRGL